MVLSKSDSLDIALLWESFKIFLKFLIRQYRYTGNINSFSKESE